MLNAPDETQQTELTLLAENIRPDRVDEDLVFQVMVDWGLDYSLPMVKESIRGCDVYSIDSGALVACFAKQMHAEVISEMARMQPLRVAFLDSSFETDSQRINVEQIFRELSPATQVKVI